MQNETTVIKLEYNEIKLENEDPLMSDFIVEVEPAENVDFLETADQETTLVKPSNFQHKCSKCPFTSLYKLNLMEHVQEVHSSNRVGPRFKCSTCSFLTDNLLDLKQHLMKYKTHLKPHSIEKKIESVTPYLKKKWCSECAFFSRSVYALKTHMVSVHGKLLTNEL